MKLRTLLKKVSIIYLAAALIMTGMLVLLCLSISTCALADSTVYTSVEKVAPAQKEVKNSEPYLIGGVSIFLESHYADADREAYEKCIADLRDYIDSNTIQSSAIDIYYESAPLLGSIPTSTRWVGPYRLNLRSSTEIRDDNILEVLNPFEKIEILLTTRNDDWITVKYGDDLGYVLAEYVTDVDPAINPKKEEKIFVSDSAKEKTIYVPKIWDGSTVLTKSKGRVDGPSGSETYYNLDMTNIVKRLQRLGFEGEYWVRDDGVKMYGDYIMIAADFSTRPIGTILPTTLGEGIVCDTGGFVEWNPTGIDIATAW